ncbi:glycosyltransferase family 39 protein [Nocardia sp. CDC159]|uniref:Glycosyltransferase family 39 protein n=1 Tax=Nocardia pulmonis TaxID=2951408 RepID=A0A9X2IZR4_9NOCA|nr:MULTISPECIES: glycosyltransferase family 39 protein [Nocardia]MCM6777698.1 glycosyltransferase family 39 protein [Nocardia pulmonis]MCM6790498.1 glycosyltransferase family 39 protein [Nocardia sp. CDC159]
MSVMLSEPTVVEATPPVRRDRRAWSLVALLVATAALYLWNLGASGWANQFYAAAVQAGSTSWKAMLFGSTDAANSITVDKTPGALWVMDISARLFGFDAWSLLAPQALAGVAAVAVLYAAVRRVAGHGAGLLAGAVLASTPVAALMFRYDNPDALLVLLLTVAAYCVLRATEKDAAARWLPLAGVAIGCGFLTKMMQAFLVLPAFALVYLLAAHVPWRARLLRSVGAVLAVVVSAGWYPALVALWPADSRPYIGGSQHNSVLELALGYNGFGRITGNEPGGLGNTDFDAGWARLFGDQMGGQIAWLLPAALVLGVAGLWALRRAPRTDAARAALLLWLGWLVVTGVVFSFAGGILHPYYTVALAPAIGGSVGIGAALMWRRRSDIRAAAVLSGAVLLTVILAWVLLRRTPEWLPWLGPAIAVTGVVAAVLLLGVGRMPRRVAIGAAAVAVVTSLAAPVGYSVATVTTSHGGPIPTAGPPGAGWGHFRLGKAGGPWGGRNPGGGGNGANPGGGTGVSGGNSPDGGSGAPGHGGGRGDSGASNAVPGPHGAPGDGMGGGPMAGLFGAAEPGANIVATLEKDADEYTWAAAAVGSNSAATYQLAIRYPVMAIGGYNGTDPSPTLERFESLVAQHKIHYFIDGQTMGGRRGGSSGGSDAAQRIAQWVRSNFAARTIDGVTVYDLG